MFGSSAHFDATNSQKVMNGSNFSDDGAVNGDGGFPRGNRRIEHPEFSFSQYPIQQQYSLPALDSSMTTNASQYTGYPAPSNEMLFGTTGTPGFTSSRSLNPNAKIYHPHNGPRSYMHDPGSVNYDRNYDAAQHGFQKSYSEAPLQHNLEWDESAHNLGLAQTNQLKHKSTPSAYSSDMTSYWYADDLEMPFPFNDVQNDHSYGRRQDITGRQFSASFHVNDSALTEMKQKSNGFNSEWADNITQREDFVAKVLEPHDIDEQEVSEYVNNQCGTSGKSDFPEVNTPQYSLFYPEWRHEVTQGEDFSSAGSLNELHHSLGHYPRFVEDASTQLPANAMFNPISSILSQPPRSDIFEFAKEEQRVDAPPLVAQPRFESAGKLKRATYSDLVQGKSAPKDSLSPKPGLTSRGLSADLTDRYDGPSNVSINKNVKADTMSQVRWPKPGYRDNENNGMDRVGNGHDSSILERKQALSPTKNCSKQLSQQHSLSKDSTVRASQRVFIGRRNSSLEVGQRKVSQDSIGSKDLTSSYKRVDTDGAPSNRQLPKEFYKAFRAKEKEGYDEAIEYAESCLKSGEIPVSLRWRVFLEMADISKRENRFPEARKYYKMTNEEQPSAPQGWLEYSKMEDECGHIQECRDILYKGLEYCLNTDQLLTKAIKHEERLGNLGSARALLSRLRNQNIDKTWKAILEGALMEARAGNTVVARKIFKYLMRHVPWFGPIYCEAAKFEEKNEEFERAITVVEKGLKEVPRYGPLWFVAFRLYEKIEWDESIRKACEAKGGKSANLLQESEKAQIATLHAMFGVSDDDFAIGHSSIECSLTRTRAVLKRAMKCISRELIWKVHFEAGRIAEHGGCPNSLLKARQAYVQSILQCPINLRWKVWLAGARAELAHGNFEQAQKLIDRAFVDVPQKSRAFVLLENARFEEYIGNVDKAREILTASRLENSSEWKIFLESVLLEIRVNNFSNALIVAEQALAIHPGTGRLWAILVQLKYQHGPDAQRLAFREALKQVPKSGEVWCEGSRIYMNPLSPYVDFATAQRYLLFGIQFTPQFGDSFIELLRWQLLLASFGDGSLLEGEGEDIDEDEFRENMLLVDTSEVELRCANADPNYGALWFHCRRGPYETAYETLRTAKKFLVSEITKFRHVYRDAIRESLQYRFDLNGESNGVTRKKKSSKARTTPSLINGENIWMMERLRRYAPEAVDYADFSSGLLSVNWMSSNVPSLVNSERRKLLFGSDQIIP